VNPNRSLSVRPAERHFASFIWPFGIGNVELRKPLSALAY